MDSALWVMQENGNGPERGGKLAAAFRR